jgi:hypothetical protein
MCLLTQDSSNVHSALTTWIMLCSSILQLLLKSLRLNNKYTSPHKYSTLGLLSILGYY